MWVFSLYTMVDGYFVANYVGPVEFSAINIAMPFVNTLFALAIIFAVGTSTLVGIALGQGNLKKANSLFSTTLLTLTIFSLGATGIFHFFLDDIVILLGATEHTVDFVREYIAIVLYFSIFFMVSYNFEVLIKVDGFPILATVGVAASALTNVFFDWLFVAKLGWGVAGAAWATGIAQVFSTLLFLYHFLFGKARLRFTRNVDFTFLSRVFPIGTGDFIAEMSTGIIVFLFNRFLPGALGELSLVAYTVTSYVTLLISMTMTGLTQGVQPLISFYLGKRDTKTVGRLLKMGFLGIALCSAVSLLIVNLFPEELAGLFLDKAGPEILTMTYDAMRRYSTAYLFVGFNLLAGGFFAAIGRARPSILINLARGVIFISLSLTLVSTFLPGPCIWYAAAISEGCCFLLSMSLLVYFLKTIERENREE